MRYYLTKDTEEYVFDLIRTIRHTSDVVEFHFMALDKNKTNYEKPEKIFLRKLAGQYFTSFDQTHWQKLARQDIPTKLLNINRVFELHRGFRPSGVTGEGTGSLITQMPGKAVKIPVKIGDKVKVGQTVIILEAMKMENEIKSQLDGVVKNIFIKEGDILEQGVKLLEIVEEK